MTYLPGVILTALLCGLLYLMWRAAKPYKFDDTDRAGC